MGHIVGKDGIKVDPKKITAIQEWPKPSTVTAMRSFLGMTSYYRRFIQDYAKIASPLTDTTKGSPKKREAVEWNESRESAFRILKERLMTAPVLKPFNPDLSSIIETDASDYAVGATLVQQNKGQSCQPVAFFSRRLKPAEVNYAANERELLAILQALREWRCYVEGTHVTILSDHKLDISGDAEAIAIKPSTMGRELQHYDFEIRYKAGKDNIVADARSRREDHQDQIAMDSASLFNILAAEYSDWPKFLPEYLKNGTIPSDCPRELVDTIRRESTHFEYDNDQGILYRKLSNTERAAFCRFIRHADVVDQTHRGNGHLAPDSIWKILRKRSWWPGMRQDIKAWISRCPTCQIVSSPLRNQRSVPLHPLPVATEPFARWGLDSIGILPKTKNGNMWIIVAIDYATNWPVAKALPEATATAVAKFLYEDIMAPYGCPKEILMDRGANFLALSLSQYLELQKIKHLKTSAYHPRTNGKTERYNGVLGTMLTKFVGSQKNMWDEFLPQAVFATRIREHTVTKQSPFRLVYGIDPCLPGDSTPPNLSQPTNEEERLQHNESFLNRWEPKPSRGSRSAAENGGDYEKNV